MTEGQVVNACIRYLWLKGCFVWRQNTGAYKPEGSNRFIRYGTPGCPDIVGLTPSGRFLGVECKVGLAKQTPHQVTFQNHIERHNGIYILARSIDDLEARKHDLE